MSLNTSAARGTKGEDGAKGDTGADGPIGPQGDDGADGTPADLSSPDNIFYVDLNTTVLIAERDGSIHKPFISMTEGLAAVNTPTVDSQHTFIFSPGNYSDNFVLPVFTHLFNYASTPLSVTLGKITITGTGGQTSINRCQLLALTYDTTAGAGSDKSTLVISDSDIATTFSLLGRGAGSDEIIFKGVEVDGDYFVRDVLLVINDFVSNNFTGSFSLGSTNNAINLLNGDALVIDIETLSIPNGTNVSFIMDTGHTASVTIRNSILPEFLISGAGSVTIARDANSVFDIIPNPTVPTIIDLDKAGQVEYDNSQSGLNSTDVKGAVDEVAIIAQLAGSSTVNGSADVNPIVMSVDDATHYSTTSATFVYIDTIDPLNHVRTIKEYIGETGKLLNSMGTQRNVFMYMDVSQTPPVIVESLSAPEIELNMSPNLVSIGNFDLNENGGAFDSIQGENTFVHASYAEHELSKMLHVTRGSFNVFGSEFSAEVGGTPNLLLDITAGRGIRLGVNIQADYRHPDIIDGAAGVINNVNMQYIGPAGETITIFRADKQLDVTKYALDGVLELAGNQFQIIYLYKFYGSDSIRAHLGTETFVSILGAEAVVNPLGPSPRSDQTLEAQLRTALIVRGVTASLTTGTDAKFIQLV